MRSKIGTAELLRYTSSNQRVKARAINVKHNAHRQVNPTIAAATGKGNSLIKFNRFPDGKIERSNKR